MPAKGDVNVRGFGGIVKSGIDNRETGRVAVSSLSSISDSQCPMPDFKIPRNLPSRKATLL
jgi:hypothetical protein